MKKILLLICIGINPAIIAQTPGNGVTDIDGNEYPSVIIGDQEWMVENLKTTHYKNGDVIPNITGGNEWANLDAGAYSIYNNESSNGVIYGKIYNGYAFKDSRGICPEGWDIPTNQEWINLVDAMGGQPLAGGPLKADTSYWDSPNTGATDSSGFSALPSGFRQNVGTFLWLNEVAVIAMDDSNNLARIINYDNTFVHYLGANNKTGVCVRCIKSDETLNIEIEENLDKTSIQFYPNPILNELNVNLSSYKVGKSYKIVDVMGRIITTGLLYSIKNIINLSELKPGMYIFIYEDSSTFIIKQ
jgi:uncharacterized protein (TIGR02145 family)